jgi:hypothetical protein
MNEADMLPLAIQNDTRRCANPLRRSRAMAASENPCREAVHPLSSQPAQPTKEVNMKPAPRSVGRPLAAALALFAVTLGAAFHAQAQTFDSGSTGADGALNPTVNTEVVLPPSGILNYSSVNIPSGVTVTFKRNTLNTPVVLLVLGNATIAGTISVNGSNATAVGSAGDGNQGDDGQPGRGGPGGFDGGRGGPSLVQMNPSLGGAGLGPGGGLGETSARNGCGGYGAGHAVSGAGNNCDSNGAGTAYGSSLVLPLIGGSGGGGGHGRTNSEGAGGGGGAGAILIAAGGTLNVTGAIYADGGWGGFAAGTDVGSWGGGGSGGAIRLVATAVAGNGVLQAIGGCAGGSGSFESCWAPSSKGRIRIEGFSITRTQPSNPADTKDTPGPVFIPNSPTIRIASVAGQSVPATPTGNADVTLPTAVVNPVTVTFESTNVPLGNTIALTVTPANGTPTSAVSTAIAGSLAAGTASVQVTLPQGPSVLQARTTYTIVASLGDALSNFAANERVERLDVTATLGGDAGGVKLVTVSGRTFDAPPAALALIDAFNLRQALALSRAGS